MTCTIFVTLLNASDRVGVIETHSKSGQHPQNARVGLAWVITQVSKLKLATFNLVMNEDREFTS